MNRNPFLKALVALVYIIVIVLVINLVAETETNFGIGQFVIPIMFISLFTLSAAVMGYIFCLEPLKMYLDGKKKEAITLFTKTVIAFALYIIVLFVAYFIGFSTPGCSW